MNWIKAKLALLIIGIVWGSLILVCTPLMAVAYFYDTRRSDIEWLYSIFLGQDYLVSAILGNSHQTTISALLGHMQKQGSISGTMVAKFVDLIFYVARGEENHCINAMRDTDVYYFSARRAMLGFTCYCLGFVFIFYAIITTALTEVNWG